ncbi:MAG: ABC transporter permease [Caldilineaceae bacterium]|nr:ABC transporter permease [Caldilineaceae bacterium]
MIFNLIGRRLISALPSLAGVILVTFILTHLLPGDPAAYFAGPSATPAAVEQIRSRLGLDQSLPRQFVRYLRDMAQGDLGVSLSTGRPVRQELLQRLPASLELTLFGLFFAIVIAIPLGVFSAARPGTWIDHTTRLVTTAGVSLPVFFTGLVLIYFLYFRLGWAPSPIGRLSFLLSAPPQVTGFYLIDSLLSGNLALFWGCLQQIILPAITLGIVALAPLARMTRASMLGVLSSDFIRSARANGLPPGQILFGYALRNAFLPVLTTMGMVFSFLLGANVLVEKVFAWPGIGSYAIESLITADYAPVQAFVLAMGLLYVILNLVIDILYGVIDPRVRIQA